MKKEYCGCRLTREDSWLIEVTQIGEDLRVEEPALMRTRWFDYRHLLPAQATYLFAHYYAEVYKDFYAKTRDHEAAAGVKPLLVEDVFQSAELVPIWRARQAADRICCRYDFYLRFAFDRAWSRCNRFLPRPNQLYGEELMLDAADAWKAWRKASLELARTERFKAAAYIGHPDQDDYHTYLVEQINLREHRYMPLCRVMYRENILPEEVAAKHFSPDVIKKARSLFCPTT